MWVGQEIEGSFSRQDTLFVEAAELDNFTAQQIISKATEFKCKMIYLGAGTSILQDEHWKIVSSMLQLDSKMLFTAELFVGKNEFWFSNFQKHAEGYLRKRLHIILTMPYIDSSVLRTLRESDDIKIQEGEVGRLWTWPIGTAASVCDYPEDYHDDTVV